MNTAVAFLNGGHQVMVQGDPFEIATQIAQMANDPGYFMVPNAKDGRDVYLMSAHVVAVIAPKT